MHLNRNGVKQFAKNLIDAIQELWKLEKPFSDLTQNDTYKLIENQISSYLWVTFIEVCWWKTLWMNTLDLSEQKLYCAFFFLK